MYKLNQLWAQRNMRSPDSSLPYWKCHLWKRPPLLLHPLCTREDRDSCRVHEETISSGATYENQCRQPGAGSQSSAPSYSEGHPTWRGEVQRERQWSWKARSSVECMLVALVLSQLTWSSALFAHERAAGWTARPPPLPASLLLWRIFQMIVVLLKEPHQACWNKLSTSFLGIDLFQISENPSWTSKKFSFRSICVQIKVTGIFNTRTDRREQPSPHPCSVVFPPGLLQPGSFPLSGTLPPFGGDLYSALISVGDWLSPSSCHHTSYRAHRHLHFCCRTCGRSWRPPRCRGKPPRPGDQQSEPAGGRRETGEKRWVFSSLRRLQGNKKSEVERGHRREWQRRLSYCRWTKRALGRRLILD